MIGDKFHGWTTQVGQVVFVVHKGGVYRGKVESLVANERQTGAVVRIVFPEPNRWDDVVVSLADLHDTPDYACRAAFAGKPL